jgi:hypothetical protein
MAIITSYPLVTCVGLQDHHSWSKFAICRPREPARVYEQFVPGRLRVSLPSNERNCYRVGDA